MKRARRARAIQRGAELFESFRERPARSLSRIVLPDEVALMVMGTLHAVEYETTHGRRGELYRHVFHDGSYPLLCAGTANQQLFLVGGRYHVTERGIVDLDGRGNELED